MKLELIHTLILVLLLGFAGCTDQRPTGIDLTDPGRAKLLRSFDGGVVPDECRSLIASASVQPVDLRDVIQYQKGHLDNALNIPVAEILDRNNLNMLERLDKPILLYGSEVHDGIAPWWVLTATGFQDVQVALGGYEVLVFDSMSMAWASPSERFDYKQEYEKAVADILARKEAEKPAPVVRYISPDPSPVKKKVEIKPKKRKPAIQEEGC